MANRVNALTVQKVKQFEALRLTAYPDPGSKNGEPWTIGYGHTSDSFMKVYKGLTITAAQAEAALVHDLGEAAAIVSKYVSRPLNENQFGALVSFAFNIGEGQFRSSTMVRQINAGNLADVPNQFRRWVYNDGKVMTGLKNRREAEIALWNTPVSGVSGTRPAPKPSTPAPTAPATSQPTGVAALVRNILRTLGFKV